MIPAGSLVKASRAGILRDEPNQSFVAVGTLGMLGTRKIWGRSSYMDDARGQTKVIKRIIFRINLLQSEMWFNGVVAFFAGFRLCNLHQQYSTKSQG